MPTLVEVAGGRYPEEHANQEIIPLEGKSFVPVLKGHQRDPHDQLFWEWAGNRAVRQGDWKAVYSKRDNQWQLFNLAEDRCETVDLAAENAELMKSLSDNWKKWSQQTGLKVRSKSRKKGQ